MSKFSPSAEPVAWTVAATDVVAAVAFFAHFTPGATAVVTGAVVSVLGIFTHRAVTPMRVPDSPADLLPPR